MGPGLGHHVLEEREAARPDLRHVALDAEEDFAPLARLIQAVIAGLALALTSIPIRILMGLFPERSEDGLVRLLRRVLVGALCGPLPVMTVALLSGNGGSGEEVLFVGLLLGAIVGLGDTIGRDRRPNQPAPDEPELPD